MQTQISESSPFEAVEYLVSAIDLFQKVIDILIAFPSEQHTLLKGDLYELIAKIYLSFEPQAYYKMFMLEALIKQAQSYLEIKNPKSAGKKLTTALDEIVTLTTNDLPKQMRLTTELCATLIETFSSLETTLQNSVLASLIKLANKTVNIYQLASPKSVDMYTETIQSTLEIAEFCLRFQLSQEEVPTILSRLFDIISRGESAISMKDHEREVSLITIIRAYRLDIPGYILALLSEIGEALIGDNFSELNKFREKLKQIKKLADSDNKDVLANKAIKIMPPLLPPLEFKDSSASELDSKLADFQIRIKQLEEANKNLARQAGNLKNSYSEAQQALTNRNKKIKYLNDKLNIKEWKNVEFEQQLYDKNKEVLAHQQEELELNQKIDDLYGKFELEQKIHQKTTHETSTEIADLKEALRKSKKIIQNHNSETHQLRESLNENQTLRLELERNLKSAQANYEKTILTKNAEIDHLKAALQKGDENIQQYTKRIQSLEEFLSQNQSEQQELKLEREEHRKIIRETGTQIVELQKILQEREQTILNDVAEINKLQRSLKENQTRQVEYEQKQELAKKSQHNFVLSVVAQANEIKSSNTQLEQQLVDKHADIRATMIKVNKYKEQINSLLAIIADYEKLYRVPLSPHPLLTTYPLGETYTVVSGVGFNYAPHVLESNQYQTPNNDTGNQLPNR